MVADAPTNAVRLTDAQRDLAAAHFDWAVSLAQRFALRCPGQYDTFLSAAMFGLCLAARGYDPAEGTEFKFYAFPRIRGAMLDSARRELPKGFRRKDRDGAAPATLPLDADLGDGLTGHDLAASGDLPVGWELESQDAVDRLAAKLPPAHARAMRLRYLRADVHAPTEVARVMGVSPSRFFQMLRDARKFLTADQSATPSEACP